MRDVEQNREHYTKLVSQSEETSITGSWGSNQDFRYKILADKKVFGGGGEKHIRDWMRYRRIFRVSGAKRVGTERQILWNRYSSRNGEA